MNSIQTLANEVAQLTSGNKLYDTYQTIWKYLLESYVGGEEYRSAGHLTRYQLETQKEYSARLQATPLENHCQSVISVYNSFLFREEPDRDFGNNTQSFELEMFLRDADLDGRSLNAFMKDVATWSSVFGNCWIIVSKPNVGAVTVADEQAQGVRPYVSLLTPMVVLDWTWKRALNGRYELVYFKYLEDVNGDVRTVKEWTRDTITTTVVNVKNPEILEQTVEVNGLGKIPAVCAYNGRSTTRGIGISDITDIADQQRFIYNATSEVEASIRMNTHPSLVTTAETVIGTGAGSIIQMETNLDPGLKPYLLEFNGASVDSIYQAIKHAIDTIDKMANTGAVRAVESRTMSGVAMETEFALLNARLSEKADNLELAEEQMWQFWFEYQGEQWMGEIDYPGSFNIRDTSKEIEQLQTAASAAQDPKVRAAIDAQILDWLDLDEDELASIGQPDIINPNTIPEEEQGYEFAPHIMVDPITGEERLVSSQEEHIVLANKGWYHKE
ncbi:Portal protein [uncultured Caudovirales phage]|uniref:Portal protein n=1 Tax=uncultured Caudovirales phage TaxID=2100421 RepID=A0A6J7X4Z2_9CAUD|nr:Portal protein [uncultured Caudovirales phage]